MRSLVPPILILLSAVSLFAEDWPQWLGPRRDGSSSETGLPASWPGGGPARVWQREVGAGYSGPVVAGERLVLFHRLGDREVVECLEASTGKKLWEFGYPTAFDDGFGKGNGPRSTPVIHAGRVVTLGAEGWVHCLDLQSGRKIWDVPLHKKYTIPPSFFGVGTSPVIAPGNPAPDLVLINVGAKEGGIMAFSLDSGKEVWKAARVKGGETSVLRDPASYSSPVLCTVAGQPRAVFFTRTGAVVLDPKTGQADFEKPWRSRMDASVNAATPLVVDDLAFFSACYGTGAVLLKLRSGGADEVWSGDEIMSNHYSTCVHHQGYLYGFTGRQESGPSLRSIELKTGKIQWTRDRFGCGSMILVQGRLLMLTEEGELVLADADPKEYRELARARILDAAPCRAQIALAEGRLFARDRSKLGCWKLR